MTDSIKNSKNIYRVHRYFYDENGTENLHLPFIAPVIAPLLKSEFPKSSTSPEFIIMTWFSRRKTKIVRTM